MNKILLIVTLLSSFQAFSSEYLDLEVISKKNANSQLFSEGEIPNKVIFSSEGVSIVYPSGSHGFSNRNNFIGEKNHKECNVRKIFYKASTVNAEYILHIEDRRKMFTDIETEKLIIKNGCLDIYKDNKTVVVLTKSERGFSSQVETLILKER